MNTLDIQYFAVLRQCAGKTAETRASSSPNLGALYEELREAYGFPLPLDHVRVAVDGAYVPMETPLRDNMTVTFIPPVAGG